MITSEQMALLRMLLTVSAGLAVLPVAVGVIRGLLARLPFYNFRHSSKKYMILLYVCLLAAVWLMRFAVDYYSLKMAGEAAQMQWLEALFDSLTHALQTFSMDEEYTNYIINGKAMVAHICGQESVWVTRYGIYAAAMNVIAPVAGGAFVFEILASIFPRLALLGAHLMFWKDKHYFSALDERSLALAKSIRAAERTRLRMPILIFTDVYSDKQEEKDAELLQEAKDLGAICLRDDVVHVPKNINGRRSTFYLIDEKSGENLRSLVALSRLPYLSGTKRARVYIFTHNDAYEQIEQQLRERLNQQKMTVIPVQSYRNLALNLLVKLPLYEPLVHQEGSKQLKVTILGNGLVGTEMFLAVYWLGQMLDCKLNIHVVSQDPQNVFWEKLNHINPEIWHTCQENDAILRCSDTTFSAPYCHVNYTCTDVKQGAFWEMEELLNTDYFIVALGSDATNMRIAQKLRYCVGQQHLRNCAAGQKTVIAYAVYQPELCAALNRTRCYCSYDKDKPDIYMHAFGSLNQEYAIENIAMTDYQMLAREVGEGYLQVRQNKIRIEANHKRGETADADYEYWTNLARAMHLKYAVFSLGWIETSVFDSAQEDKSDHAKAVERACALFRGAAIGCRSVAESSREQLRQQRHRLAWLEHRRWCAFLRTKGFQKTDAYETYFYATGSYKHMSLKLHPCLRECDDRGMRELFVGEALAHPERVADALDALSVALYPEYNDYDFKMYDYPEHAFPFVSHWDAADKLGLSEKRMRILCCLGLIPGAVRFLDTKEWILPSAEVKKREKKQPEKEPASIKK